MPDNVVTLPPRALGEGGGPIDETRAAIAIHGDDLDPEEITKMLGCEPTSAHRKGDKRTDMSAPALTGEWILSVRGAAPVGPEELTSSLLLRLPTGDALWRTLADRFRVELRFALHLSAYSRGFELSAPLTERISALHASVGFDIYLDTEDVA